MSQADLNIADQSRSTFRAEVNQSLQALATLSAGATEPTTTYAYQLWADSSSGLLKQRNGANSAWINKGGLDDADWGFLQKNNPAVTGLLSLSAAADIASTSVVDLTAATGNTAIITGSTTITAFTMNDGQQMELIAGGAFTLTYHATTMNINGGASYTCAAGDRLSVFKDGAGVVRVNVTKQDGTAVVGGSKQIQPITASVGASALTVTLNPTSLDFRDATLTSGTVNTRTISSAISCVVPSTATLGTINAVQSRIVVLAIDNAGNVELAVVNIAGGNDLSETGVISTTALSSTADISNVIYSTTARTNVPYRVVGYVESTQATAGTWATVPSTIQGYGGQALAAMSSLGYGQTWQSVTGSRVASTTYYNTTGKPIQVAIVSGSGSPVITVNGVGVASGQGTVPTVVVPQMGSYALSAGTFTAWSELR